MVNVQKVLGGRRISIPASVSEELGIDVGELVIVEWKNGSLKIIPAEVSPRSKSK